jgi:hypothetical protein
MRDLRARFPFRRGNVDRRSARIWSAVIVLVAAAAVGTWIYEASPPPAPKPIVSDSALPSP